MTDMNRNNDFRARQLRSLIDGKLSRMDGLTGGGVVSACQHRTAREISKEVQDLQAKLDKLEGREPQTRREPTRMVTETEATRLRALIQRLERRGEAQHPDAELARQVLADPARRITEAHARRLGIGR